MEHELICSERAEVNVFLVFLLLHHTLDTVFCFFLWLFISWRKTWENSSCPLVMEKPKIEKGGEREGTRWRRVGVWGGEFQYMKRLVAGVSWGGGNPWLQMSVCPHPTRTTYTLPHTSIAQMKGILSLCGWPLQPLCKNKGITCPSCVMRSPSLKAQSLDPHGYSHIQTLSFTRTYKP